MIEFGIHTDYKSYPEEEQLTNYQNTILSIFQLKYFDEEQITSKICDLFNHLKNNNYIHGDICSFLLEKAKIVHSNDIEMGFLLLYSFDYCDKFHYCIEKAIQLIYDHEQFRKEIISIK